MLSAAAVLVALAASSAVVSGSMPNISCTFTADITLTSIYNYKINTYRYKHYSSAGRAFRKIGEIQWGYPGNSSMMFKPPNKYYFLEPFFGRTVCSIVPIQESFECFQLDSDARCESANVTCPNDHDRRCDVWSFTNYKEDYVRYWVYSGTSNLHKVRIAGDFFDETYVFNSFDPREPDPSILEMPPTQPCVDLTVDPNPNPNPELAYLFNHKKAQKQHSEKVKREPSRVYYNPEYSRTDVLVNDPARIKEIALRATTWKAGANAAFEGKTVADFARMLRWPGTSLAEGSRAGRRGAGKSIQGAYRGAPELVIPEEFDARTAWPACGIDVIRDQGSCGSCWAFGAVETLEDRFCIHGNWEKQTLFSPMYLVSCYKDLDGCDGGFTDIAWQDLVVNGTTTEECFPYKMSAKCPEKCVDGSDIKLFKPKNAYSVFIPFAYEDNVKAIQQEIMINGPVETTFWVFGDFSNYQSGVYKRTSTTFSGAHAVKIIGWGVDKESGEKYWTIANSWGPDWGENGFFRIARGINECGIEDEIVAGIPDIQ